MGRWIHGALVAVALLGCNRGGKATAVPSAFNQIPYRDGDVHEDARVFLVAGGDDIANFAAEILEQRGLWIGAGLSQEQIACYYAKPTQQAWTDDLEQYEELATALRACFRADPGRVQRDLAAVAERDPDWVYLYVTAHGLDSQVKGLIASGSRRLQRVAQSLQADERALLDAPAIGLNAGPAPRLGEVTALVKRLRDGAEPRDVLFTPDTLQSTLSEFPERTLKVVVLQACFSGGFIDHHIPGKPAGDVPSLTSIPNLVALTATAAERPSFGCGSGSARTFFGGAFNRALERGLTPNAGPDTVDWATVHERAAFAVEAMEWIEAETPSMPGYFTSVE